MVNPSYAAAMTRDERLSRFQAVLTELDGVAYAYAVFEDVGRWGRVIQVGLGIHSDADAPGYPDTIEATNRYGGEAADLTSEQATALTELGFDISAVPYPSRRVGAALATEETAKLCDDAFLALGAAVDFTVGVYSAASGEREWNDEY
jgi:hypothetical protein